MGIKPPRFNSVGVSCRSESQSHQGDAKKFHAELRIMFVSQFGASDELRFDRVNGCGTDRFSGR
jgi:hypothetical protein